MRLRIWRAAAMVAASLAFCAVAVAAEEKKPTVVEKAAPSPCKGLDNAACTAKAECSWVKETKMKNGKMRKAYCRKKSTRSAQTKKPA
jgi:hypothetical protein